MTPTEQAVEDDRLIRALLQNWVVWRDAGDWERFRTVWHPDGRMMATWTQGTADEFIAISKAGWAKGVSILHFLGGISVDLAGDRAVSQTKMTISQRLWWMTSRSMSSARAGSTTFWRSGRGVGGSCCGSRSTRRIAWMR